MEWPTRTMKDIVVCPTSPPVGLMIVIVSNPVKGATIAIRSVQLNF